MKLDDTKLNNYQKIISKNHKKIKNQADEITNLQNKLNMANKTVHDLIEEVNSCQRILSSKQVYLENSLSDFEKHYESQLKVHENELDRRLTIIHYLEERITNEIQSHNCDR